MIALAIGFLLLLALLLWFFLFPVRYVPKAKRMEYLLEPPDLFLYSYVLHVHTQFSYDSLGKPEDVVRTRDTLGIDYAVVTDHDNDLIKAFADDRLIAGKEIKLNDGRGRLQGDLLDIGSVKVIAHNFRSKYRWKLPKHGDYLLELIDLRDALLEKKLKLILYLVSAIFLYPFAGSKVVRNFTKLIDIEHYARAYFEEGWDNEVVGGLDHHVKLYINEVRKRIMVPDYSLSFSLMRNFLLIGKRVSTKEEFLEGMKEGRHVISFSGKPAIVWVEDGNLKVLSPFSNTYIMVLSRKGTVGEFVGSNCVIENIPEDNYLVLGYNFNYNIGKLLIGVRPSFVVRVRR